MIAKFLQLPTQPPQQQQQQQQAPSIQQSKPDEQELQHAQPQQQLRQQSVDKTLPSPINEAPPRTLKLPNDGFGDAQQEANRG